MTYNLMNLIFAILGTGGKFSNSFYIDKNDDLETNDHQLYNQWGRTIISTI